MTISQQKKVIQRCFIFIYSEIHEKQFYFEHFNCRYIFVLSTCNLFLTSLKFFISSDNEFHICGRKTLGNCSNTFPLGLSNL